MADSSTYPAAVDPDMQALVPDTSTPTAARDFLMQLADAVRKIEQELGTTPSDSFDDVAARLTDLAGRGRIVNTDGEGTTLYMGTTDPEAMDPPATPALGDVWLNTTPV